MAARRAVIGILCGSSKRAGGKNIATKTERDGAPPPFLHDSQSHMNAVRKLEAPEGPLVNVQLDQLRPAECWKASTPDKTALRIVP
jgi:hypothetical protein